MKILTLIIPAYDSHAFLDRCLQSMLCPEVLDRLEIVIVDDGSTDDTALLAQGYCQRYPQTVRLIRQENRGHGGALNAGCAAAQGTYLKVIDADDWVETDALPAFIDRLSRCQADVVLTHYRTVDITTGQIRDWRCAPRAFHTAYTLAEVLDRWEDFAPVVTFHGITYRTDFYREKGMALSEHIFYEDHEFSTVPCCYAGRILPMDLTIYDYRVGDVAQSVSDSSQLRRIGHLQAVLQRLMDEYGARDLSPSGRAFFCRKALVVLLRYLTITLLLEPDRRKGRRQAADMMDRFSRQMPDAWAMARGKYQVFLLMSRLHISKSRWDRFLRSRLYRALRRTTTSNKVTS